MHPSKLLEQLVTQTVLFAPRLVSSLINCFLFWLWSVIVSKDALKGDSCPRLSTGA